MNLALSTSYSTLIHIYNLSFYDSNSSAAFTILQPHTLIIPAWHWSWTPQHLFCLKMRRNTYCFLLMIFICYSWNKRLKIHTINTQLEVSMRIMRFVECPGPLNAMSNLIEICKQCFHQLHCCNKDSFCSVYISICNLDRCLVDLVREMRWQRKYHYHLLSRFCIG